jgi:DNA-binding winged helix-turn-helix (wHTH) protein/Tol biopolymer transport system component
MNQQPVHDGALPAAEAPTDPNGTTAHNYTFGPFTIDVAARHLIRDGALVPMTAKVFDTLLVLVKNHDRAVSKEELIHAVWPNTFVSDDSLVQNISAIRRALGDDSSQPQYIATLARRGYRFIAAVEEHAGGDIPVVSAKEAIRTEPASHPAAIPPGPVHARTTWIALGAFSAGILLAALLISLFRTGRPATNAAAPIRFREMLPAGQVLAEGAAISPDGRTLAFVASDANGRRQLWIRSLDSETAMPIEGTAGAVAPFWSPDSNNIAYFSGNHIKRLSRSGGPGRPVATLQRGLSLGGSWSPNDRILFCDRGKIFAVNASGGDPAVIVEPSAKLVGDFRWPRALSDGRHFLFVVNSDNANQSGTYLGTFGSADAVRVLTSAESPAEYVAPGYILYVRDHVLTAQQFDPSAGVKGEPHPIFADLSDTVDLSATSSGVLAVSQFAYGARAAWLDRSGKELNGFKVPTLFRSIAISPDNKRALATAFDSGSLALWQIDLERNVSTRLATNAGFAVWNPDGSHFAYIVVGAGGAADVAVRSTAGSDDAVWLKNDEIKVVTDWSSDARYILFNNQSRRAVWLLPTWGDHAPKPLVEMHGSTVSNGRFSPDGRVVAYASDETGVTEVYVSPFPQLGIKQQVSAGGGSQPQWRRDGQELFYFSADRHLTAVSMPGNHLSPGRPQPLFEVPNAAGPFVVANDGQRFLFLMRDHTADRGGISLLTNWMAAQ